MSETTKEARDIVRERLKEWFDLHNIGPRGRRFYVCLLNDADKLEKSETDAKQLRQHILYLETAIGRVINKEVRLDEARRYLCGVMDRRKVKR